jgi:hypothetical protein
MVSSGTQLRAAKVECWAAMSVFECVSALQWPC